MKARDLLISAAIAVLVGTLAWLWLSPSGLKHSPDISLTTIKGAELQLADYRGRPVLVTFWATTCPGCIKEMPHLAELYEELAPRGLEIIGIAMAYDPPNQVLAMAEARQLPYRIALDLDSGAARAFGDVRLTPSSFLIAPDGRIVFHKIGEMDIHKLRDDIIAMLEQAPTAGLQPALPAS